MQSRGGKYIISKNWALHKLDKRSIQVYALPPFSWMFPNDGSEPFCVCVIAPSTDNSLLTILMYLQCVSVTLQSFTSHELLWIIDCNVPLSFCSSSNIRRLFVIIILDTIRYLLLYAMLCESVKVILVCGVGVFTSLWLHLPIHCWAWPARGTQFALRCFVSAHWYHKTMDTASWNAPKSNKSIADCDNQLPSLLSMPAMMAMERMTSPSYSAASFCTFRIAHNTWRLFFGVSLSFGVCLRRERASVNYFCTVRYFSITQVIKKSI